MITLSLLKQMQTDGLGTIDSDLWHLEVPLNSQGVPAMGAWIVPRGAPVSRFNVNIQPFDFYFRHTNKNTSLMRAEQFLNYLQESYSDICELPSYEPIFSQTYSDVTITPTDSVSYVGEDENRKLVFVISGEINYKENKEN